MITLVFDDRSFCPLVRHTVRISVLIVGKWIWEQYHTIVAALTVGARSAFVATDFSMLAGIALGRVYQHFFDPGRPALFRTS